MIGETNKNVVIPFVRCDRQVLVLNERTTLADFVRDTVREKNLSYRKVAARSGGRIHASTISDIISGKYSNLSTDTLSGLADGLGVSYNELAAIVRGDMPTSEDDLLRSMLDTLYERAKVSSGEEQKFIEGNIRMLLDRLDKQQRA